MSILYSRSDRNVIPRLRSFDLTIQTGELGQERRNHSETESTKYFQYHKKKWEKHQNLQNARNLYSSAVFLGVEDEFSHIGRFILKFGEGNSALAEYIYKKISGENALLDPNTIAKDHQYLIANLKSRLIIEPKNPILWLELGRLYFLLGHKKAQKCIEISLNLDNNNRFIVRSASRFFHQNKDAERSLHIIRKSMYSKEDPWLLAADIGYSNILNRKSRLIDTSIKITKNNQQDSPFFINELASSLGTYELKNGTSKKAKEFFNISLIQPNDNALAQAYWINERNNMPLFPFANEIPDNIFTYEAQTLAEFQKENYQSAYNFALKWHKDEPYSVRPVNIAAYIDCIFLKEYDRSIALINKLINKEVEDDLLYNNLIYLLIKSSQLELANKYFINKLQPIITKEDADSPIFIATAGLVAFRNGMTEKGIELYKKSISLARKYQKPHNRALAMGNFILECLSNPAVEKGVYNNIIEEFNNYCKRTTELDILELQKDIKVVINPKLSE